jgi:hypothetical protein
LNNKPIGEENVPVFVEWRWKEKTKTFLVVFHFYDDFSRTNLRVNSTPEKNHLTLFTFVGGDDFLNDVETKGAWLTWSPSHVDLALLMELLTYSNIINGFKEAKKRSLIKHLEFISRKGTLNEVSGEVEFADWTKIGAMHNVVGCDKKLASYSENGHSYAMAELCPEYIAYIKKLAEADVFEG